MPTARETHSHRRAGANDKDLMALMASIASADTAKAMEMIAARTDLARISATKGASRADASRYFFPQMRPCLYAGDTALHLAQVATIECLVRAGANPNSTDNSGVAPIHRAVRTRCAAAVQALLSAGAKPDLPNGNGSTPLHLAVQNTGCGGSGDPEAVEQQRQIILLLLQNGASIKRRDPGRNCRLD